MSVNSELDPFAIIGIEGLTTLYKAPNKPIESKKKGGRRDGGKEKKRDGGKGRKT